MKRNNRQWLISIHNNATSLIRKWIFVPQRVYRIVTENDSDSLTIISIFKCYIYVLDEIRIDKTFQYPEK